MAIVGSSQGKVEGGKKAIRMKHSTFHSDRSRLRRIARAPEHTSADASTLRHRLRDVLRDRRRPSVALRAPPRYAPDLLLFVATALRDFADFRGAFFLAPPREDLDFVRTVGLLFSRPNTSSSRGSSGGASNAASLPSDTCDVASCNCRCSEPIMRPSDSAVRINTESSSRDRADFRAGSALLRLAIQAPPSGPVASDEGSSKARANRKCR